MRAGRFIIFIVCMFLLCGCVPKETRTVVQFASWGSKTEVDIIKPILEDFEKENPDVKVDFMHIPQNYFPKIHLLLASNTAPDVIFINNQYLPVYANFLEELETSEPYYPQALEALKYDGKLFAIPRDVSNLVIFYNKDLFDKKGIKYPSAGWNLDDFLKVAQGLTDKDTFGISFEEDPLFYLPYVMAFGGSFENINSNESQQALNFYANLRKKYHVAPLKSESASATMGQMFLQGKLGMYLSGRWMVPKIRAEASFDWDIISFPNEKVPLDASGWAVTKSSKHKKEALMLVEYLASKSCSEKFVESGLIVPARMDTSFKILDGKKPNNARVFLEVIKTSKPTPVTKDYRELLDKIKKDLEPVYN